MSTPRDLVASVGPNVFEWLPQETVFSLASRYHHLSGSSAPSRTCQQLFGHHRGGSSADFPSRVEHLVQRTEGKVGSVRSVIQEHSIAPYFFPFHPARRVERWVDQMRYGNGRNIKAEMGLLASRLGAAHPLKACTQCMASDLEAFGVAYWHVLHQLPGAQVCTKHQHCLSSTRVKVSSWQRFDWFLPAQVIASDKTQPCTCTEVSLGLSEFCEGFWSLPVGFHFDLDRLHKVIRARLMLLGAVRPNGRYEPGRLQELLTPLTALHDDVASWHGIEHLDIEALCYSLRRLLNAPATRGLHPLKYALVLCVLFPAWADFWQEHTNGQLECEPPEGAANLPQSSTAPAEKICLLQEQFLSFVRHEGMSITAASNAVNVAVATGLRWAASDGIKWKRRGKLLRPAVLNKAITLLTQGVDKMEVAKSVGASVQTVTMILSLDPALQSKWHQVRQERAKTSARSSWLRVLETMQHNTIKQCRMIEPAAFAWLYRNDLAWLKTVNAARSKVPRLPPSHIRWDSRDEQLAQLVNHTALEGMAGEAKARISIAWLRAQLPALNSMMSKLDHLPLTRCALERAIKPQSGSNTHELPF